MLEMIWRRGAAVSKVLFLYEKPSVPHHVCSSSWCSAGGWRCCAARSLTSAQCKAKCSLYPCSREHPLMDGSSQRGSSVYRQQRWKQSVSARSCGAHTAEGTHLAGSLAWALCYGYPRLSSFTLNNFDSASCSSLSSLKPKTLYCWNWPMPFCQGQKRIGGGGVYVFVFTNGLVSYSKKKKKIKCRVELKHRNGLVIAVPT